MGVAVLATGWIDAFPSNVYSVASILNRSTVREGRGIQAPRKNCIRQTMKEDGQFGELDFRSQIIQRYMPEGRLLSWPARFKRQYILIEEISRRFEPGIDYSEREVDVMLKEIYPVDHCTLRRYLVDLRFVHRRNGVYRR